MAKTPVVVGLLACEQIVIEEGTRNITPVNCFTRRQVRSVPSEPMSFVVVAFLTDGLGEVELEVIIQSLEDREMIHRITRRVAFRHSLSEYRCFFWVRDFSWPAEGTFEIMLLADGAYVAARKIRIQRESES